jgi:hypothetical protein
MPQTFGVQKLTHAPRSSAPWMLDLAAAAMPTLCWLLPQLKVWKPQAL